MGFVFGREIDIIFGDGWGPPLFEALFFCKLGVGLMRFYMNSAAEEGACRGNVFKKMSESGAS